MNPSYHAQGSRNVPEGGTRVTQWQDRQVIGDMHERRVAAALRARGWTVQPCGQGTYPPAVREALRRTRSALLHGTKIALIPAAAHAALQAERELKARARGARDRDA